jgi:hypothetical protein
MARAGTRWLLAPPLLLLLCFANEAAGGVDEGASADAALVAARYGGTHVGGKVYVHDLLPARGPAFGGSEVTIYGAENAPRPSSRIVPRLARHHSFISC